jgi:hypothetical protein
MELQKHRTEGDSRVSEELRIVKNEVGRELKANELTVRTVVVIGREDRDFAYTAWVREIGPDFVIFSYELGPETKVAFIAHLREDGTLGDDTGKRITVNEYLGEI